MWLKETEKVLNLLSKEEKLSDFVFVGGSAISYYIHHRLSEDIDLFCTYNQLKQKTLNNIIEKLRNNKHNIVVLPVEDRTIQMDLDIDGVKTTFFSWSLDLLKTNSKAFKGNIKIADLELLAGMKAYTFGRRLKIRDAYDLYALSQEIGFGNIIEFAKDFFGSLFSERLFINQVQDLSLLQGDKIEDYLNPKYKVSKNDMENYFTAEVEKYILKSLEREMENK